MSGAGNAPSPSADVVLLDAPALVDEPFENPPDRVGIERWFGGFTQPFEERALAAWIVDGNPALTFVLTHLHDEPHSLVHELQNLLIHRVDVAAELIEIELERHYLDPERERMLGVT